MTPKVGRNEPCPCGSGKKFNELFARQIAHVSVVVEYEHGHPEQRRVAGVVPGIRAAADESVIARRLDELGLRAVFTMHAGTLEARFGVESIEVLPADIIDVSGAIRSEAWSFSRVTRKPVLEVAAHLLRLICTNGAYSNRELAGARLMAWATDRQLADFVSRQIERVLEYPKAALLEAVAAMSQSVPTDDEHDDVRTPSPAPFITSSRAPRGVSWRSRAVESSIASC